MRGAGAPDHNIVLGCIALRRHRSDDDGFTLAELAVALLITALLIAMAAPTFFRARNTARDSAAKQAIRRTATLAQGVRSTEGAYPSDPAVLAAEEPGYRFTTAASTGPRVVSISGSQDAFAAVVLSESGTCWEGAMTGDGLAYAKVEGGSCGADGGLLYRAALKKGDYSQWVLAMGKNFEMRDGLFVLGRRNGKAVSGENRTFSGDPTWRDYTLGTSVDLRQGPGLGLYFRATNPKAVNGYVFQFEPNTNAAKGGSFVMRKVVNGRQQAPFASILARATPAAKNGKFDWYGGPRQVDVRVKGNTFTASVDGADVLTAKESSFAQGEVGLRSWGKSVAEFAGVEVRSQ